MTTKTIDQWAAEACGVKQFNGYWRGPGPIERIGNWTIKDPRCREIVRENFRIYTYPTKYSKDIGNDGIWSAYQGGGGHIARERTISKAEIACITAIYEASQ